MFTTFNYNFFIVATKSEDVFNRRNVDMLLVFLIPCMSARFSYIQHLWLRVFFIVLFYELFLSCIDSVTFVKINNNNTLLLCSVSVYML